MKTADLYIRVSTDEQADKGYSQRDQEERLRKYCQIKGLEVRDVYIEDYSAKTFKRPEWKKLISNLRKRKSTKNTILLFTKWDRFSRNAGDAYQMISQLRKLYVEPSAIEQPLDLSVPENKMMLAFYLASPEVENDRRSLNVFHGMRRAKKEGRYMGPASVGYVNKISEDKKKYIAIHEKEGALLKWAFEKILENKFSTEQIWKLLRKKDGNKYRFSKNNFWVALRNPLYCGKIFVPPYKEEEGYYVKGQHEPLISERKFNEVQEILEGRKKVVKPKIMSLDNLPLRGFLECPNCDRMLTGSASKGKMGKYYYYYHCSSRCGTRFKAGEVNEIFIEQLRQLSPNEAIIDMYLDSFFEEYNSRRKTDRKTRKNLLTQIDKLNNRLKEALIKNVDGKLDDDDYQKIKKFTNKELEKLESKLNVLSDINSEINGLLRKNLRKLIGIDKQYERGNIEEKRIIISSMFPKNLVFDGNRHRTQRLNTALDLIYFKTNKLKGKKNGTSLSFLDLSQEVIWLGLEPRTLSLKGRCSTN